MPVNRDNMIIVGNDLRAKNGAGYIAEELIKRALNNKKNNSIIESIRTLSEIDILRKKGGILLAVDAKKELRYKRILLRGGDKDKVTFEEFKDQEKREMESKDLNKTEFTCLHKSG
jgi:dephospho-CoA kinase